MSCLLGVCDAEVSPKNILTSEINKIGGTPDWPDGRAIKVPSCPVCSGSQMLVVQLYCCLEGSNYNRTLYLFACTNPACWNKSESWTVYRCQWIYSETANAGSVTDSKEGVKDKGSAVESWGSTGVDEGASWGEDADDWGQDADDWGEDSTDLSSLVRDSRKPDNEETKAPLPIRDDGQGSCDLQMKQLSINDVSGDVTNNETANAVCDVMDDVIDGAISDVIEDSMEEEKAIETVQILLEDMPSLSEQQKSEALRKLKTCSKQADSGHWLKSYYINVFEEQSIGEEEESGHVTKLLSEYQKREGCSIQDLVETSRCSDTGSKGKGEKYEKSSLIHRDIVFHKFLKRLSSCPQQCIRYEWNGSPLFISAEKMVLPSQCCHCGGPVVFELQLMPALVNQLKLPMGTGGVLEFGTVLVYTCQQSCWGDSDLYRTECVVVQSDPDHHLFT